MSESARDLLIITAESPTSGGSSTSCMPNCPKWGQDRSSLCSPANTTTRTASVGRRHRGCPAAQRQRSHSHIQQFLGSPTDEIGEATARWPGLGFAHYWLAGHSHEAQVWKLIDKTWTCIWHTDDYTRGCTEEELEEYERPLGPEATEALEPAAEIPVGPDSRTTLLLYLQPGKCPSVSTAGALLLTQACHTAVTPLASDNPGGILLPAQVTVCSDSVTWN